MISRRVLLGAAGALTLPVSLTANAAPVAGKDYLVVRPAVPVAAKPVIIHDFFAYTCPHCLAFAPMMDEYIKSLPKDGSVKVIPVPVAWNAQYEIFPRTYFALEALGKFDALHMPFWAWVIKEEHDWKDVEGMNADVTKWFTKNGISESDFTGAVKSFSVVAKSRTAFSTWQSYGVDSTPSVGVAGRWLTAPHLTGTRRATIETIKFLVDLAKKA